MRTLRTSLLHSALLAVGAFAPAALASPPDYFVSEQPSLGGDSSEGVGINDFGLVSGFSSLDDGSVHAAAWLYGTPLDLGTLGGADSAVLWPSKNLFGAISGVSQTTTPDPLGESWSCSSFLPVTGDTCLGFVWLLGRLQPLNPFPGGNNSFATGTNDLLQTVGWAETGEHDANCNLLGDSDQVLQFLPATWNAGNGKPRALQLESGDDSGAATAINDRGQIAGISGKCDQAVGRYTAIHMVVWNNGHPVDIGNLGGDAWNTPMAINRNGDVAGFANTAPGAALLEHAFLHGHAGGPPLDLGVLYPGDVHSQGLGINDRGQVVGLSCTAHFAACNGFLWQDGVMYDLNRLASGYDGTIIDAQDINDLGQITGQAVDASGNLVAFVATPVPHGGGHRGGPAHPAGRNAAMPAAARQALLRHLGLDRSDPRPRVQ